MITVRFQNGFSIQYNGATFASRSEHYTDLYTKSGGAWVAQVPNGALIEATIPCRMYNALDDAEAPAVEEDKKFRRIEKRLSSIERSLLNMAGR